MRKTFLLLLVFCATFLFAQSEEETHGKKGPCKEDAKKLCADVKPGEGRIIKCLKEKEQQLSEACSTHFAEVKAKNKEFANACKDDRKKFCKDVQLGGGRIIKCLKDNQASLAEACKTALAKK
ncbi:MAG: cysteine rich repeat-containing protein [Leptospiraceae bacterium]|nr:cysteine rich repeat-containing protein [Leptospiraceae bacterium]